MGSFKTYESIVVNTKGYNERWNNQRGIKAVDWKASNQVIYEAFLRVIVLMMFVKNDQSTVVYKMASDGIMYLPE